ncbi:MAG TPA: NlpC/P60 family protein [Acidimicrobiia bacterium]|nr:NlpC/P60 family protein [Acidimicrobiia bacterium]
MTLDGVAAVQMRIAQIQQLITGTAASIGAPKAPATSPTAASIAQSPQFASLLADAMGSGAAGSDPLSSVPGGTDPTAGGSSMVSQLMKLSQLSSGAPSSSMLGSAGLGGTGSTTGSSIAQTFVTNALAEQGKPYVYGANASLTDPNPKAFDCSELTKWASARAGVTIPDGATAQYLYTRDHGTTMTVQQALHTPGALLFHFGHEPRDLGDIPADGHVAISLGDGVHTIEARGHAYGTNVFDNAGGRSFNFAGMIPGM